MVQVYLGDANRQLPSNPGSGSSAWDPPPKLCTCMSGCRTMLVFNDKNVAGEKLDNAPTMNDYFGTKLPAMFSARAFGIHKAAVDAHPDRFEMLQRTGKKAFDDPGFKDAFLKSKGFEFSIVESAY